MNERVQRLMLRVRLLIALSSVLTVGMIIAALLGHPGMWVSGVVGIVLTVFLIFLYRISAPKS